MAALDYLKQHGLHVEPFSGDKIVVRPSERLNDELRAWIKAHKAELLAEVRAESTDWLTWIADRCAVVPEDRSHIARLLLNLHPRMQQRLAERYVEAWRAAADDEPTYHRRDNAGRRAANLIITKLMKGDDYV